MTLLQGMYLSDFPEDSIGEWENKTGYRGMMEVWEHKKKGVKLIIETNDDTGKEEITLMDMETGEFGSLGPFDSFDGANKAAKEFMEENQEEVYW